MTTDATTTTADDPSAADRAELIGEHRPWVTNLVLLVLVAGLSLWIYFGEDQVKTQTDLKRNEQNVFKFFKPMDVVALEIRKGGQQLLLDRDPSGDEAMMKKSGPRAPVGWQFKMPGREIAGRADDALMMRLLKAMEWEKIIVKIPEAKAKEYDFEPVMITIALRKKDGSKLIYQVGQKRAGNVHPLRFIHTGASQAVYHVSAMFGELALQELNAYRSKDLFGLGKGAVRKLLIERFTKDGTIQGLTLDYKEPHWRVDGDFADRAKVEELVEATRSVAAHKIHIDKPDDARLKTLGLLPPQFRLTVTDREGKDQVLEIGNPVKEDFPQGQMGRYARLRGRLTVVYAVPFAFLAELLAPQKDWLGTHRQELAAEKLFPITGGVESVSGLGGKFGEVSFRLRLEQGTWLFEKGDKVQGDKASVDARINALLELTVSKRLGNQVDEAALGLDDPIARLELVEGRAQRGYRYEVHIGRAGDDETGKLVAKRLLEDGSYQVYEVKGLEAVVADLRNGHLDLLDKVVFAASHWDSRKIRLENARGKTTFEAVWKNPNPAVPRTPKQWSIEQPPTPDADPDDFKTYMKTFNALSTSKYVARAETADLKEYGLTAEQRKTLTIWVQTFDSGSKTPVEQPRRLFLGSRLGDTVHVLKEGGVAIAMVEAGWLDRLELGFGKRLDVLTADLWEVRGFKVERSGKTVLDLTKPKHNWIRGGTHADNGAVEELIEAWEKVQVASPQAATEARLKETGLDAPTWKVTLIVRAEAAKQATTHVILFGKRSGARQVFAKTAAGKKLGLFFDEPLRKIEAFLKEHPEEEAPFPPDPPK